MVSTRQQPKLKTSKEHMFELYAKQSNWVLVDPTPLFFGLTWRCRIYLPKLSLAVNWVEAGSKLCQYSPATTIPLSLYLLVIYILTIENKFKYIIAIDVAYTSHFGSSLAFLIDHFNLVYFTTYRACLSCPLLFLLLLSS